jgi:large subunit ribosomal protein L6
MSRVGKTSLSVADDVKVDVQGLKVTVTGKKGSLCFQMHEGLEIVRDGNKLSVVPVNDNVDKIKKFWGLTTRSIANMIKGVTHGFTRELEIFGVGYRAAVKGNMLSLFLGYSHEIKYLLPEGVEVVCPKPTEIVISGYDNQKVGQVASLIISLRKPEPYKGKGIRIKNQAIIRKEGKKK